MEAYVVDDLKKVVTGGRGQSLDSSFVVFDVETTGFSKHNDRIIEIGAVKIVAGKKVDNFSSFVNPEIPIPYRIEQLTGITDEMVMESPTIENVLPEFWTFVRVQHWLHIIASFDMGFIEVNAKG